MNTIEQAREVSLSLRSIFINEDVSAVQARKWADTIDTLIAELATIRGQEPVEIEWPDYHPQAMGCGLEDRNITDRYEAMQYGWDQALEHVAERLPEKLFLAAGAQPIPVEPTEAMLDAARDWSFKKYGVGVGNNEAAGCWKAMLAAAPAQAQERKPLTADEIQFVAQTVDKDWHADDVDDEWHVRFARAIEQAHGIKEQA